MTTAVIETPQVPAEGATTTTPPATTPPPAATTTPPPVTTPAATTTTTPPAAGTPPAPTTGETTAPPPAAAIPVTLALSDVPEADRAFIGDDDLAQITKIANEAGWSADDAKARVAEDIALRRMAHATMYEEAKANPEIGGDNLSATQLLAKSVLDQFLPPGDPHRTRLDRDMAKLGFSNYVPLAVLLSRIGKANKEDSPTHAASTAAAEAKPVEERFWPART